MQNAIYVLYLVQTNKHYNLTLLQIELMKTGNVTLSQLALPRVTPHFSWKPHPLTTPTHHMAILVSSSSSSPEFRVRMLPTLPKMSLMFSSDITGFSWALLADRMAPRKSWSSSLRPLTYLGTTRRDHVHKSEKWKGTSVPILAPSRNHVHCETMYMVC